MQTRVEMGDLADALEHMEAVAERRLRLVDFECSPVLWMSLDDVPADLGAWTEWEDGELATLSAVERYAELVGFRGRQWAERALTWTPTTMPPVAIVELAEGYSDVGDGRGRVTYALGMGWSRVPAVVLREKD